MTSKTTEKRMLVERVLPEKKRAKHEKENSPGDSRRGQEQTTTITLYLLCCSPANITPIPCPTPICY